MSVGATLDLSRATAVIWDVVVVGAGPSGARAAALVAGAGASALMVDRDHFPRDKVCGGCLSARTLDELGAEVIRVAHGLGAQPLRALRVAGWNRHVELPLPGGLAISRRALDAAFVREAIGRGAHFLPGYRATIRSAAGSAREVELCADAVADRLRASVVIDASGLGGGAQGAGRRRTSIGHARLGCSAVVDGAAARYRSGTVHMAVGRHGYVGVARIEGGKLNIAAALDRDAVRRRGVGDAACRVLEGAGAEPIEGLAGAPWRGTPRLWQRPERRAAERLFIAGDAAGYIEPFTGEGIGWALRSAALLAPLVERAAHSWQPGLIDDWDRIYNAGLAREQRLCAMLAWLLRRPTAARWTLRGLRLYPRLAAPFVRRVHGSRPARAGGVRT